MVGTKTGILRVESWPGSVCSWLCDLEQGTAPLSLSFLICDMRIIILPSPALLGALQQAFKGQGMAAGLKRKQASTQKGRLPQGASGRTRLLSKREKEAFKAFQWRLHFLDPKPGPVFCQFYLVLSDRVWAPEFRD